MALKEKPVAAKAVSPAVVTKKSVVSTTSPAAQRAAPAAAVAKKATAAPAAASNGSAAKKSPAATASASGSKKATTATAASSSPSKKATKSGAGVPAAAAAAVVTEPDVDSEAVTKLKQEALARAEAEMEVLRMAAWQSQVDYDRKQEEKRRKKAEDESRRRKEEIFLTKALLEAAFDGEDEDLIRLLTKAQDVIKEAVDCSDVHGNTLLSEAAAGGSVTTVKLLIDRGANPNSQGEFDRSPLWRASFLGKHEVVPPLLEAGADPRVCNEQGEMPIHVVSHPAIMEALHAWDIEKTDRLVAQWQIRQEQSRMAATAQLAAEVRGAAEEAESAEEESRKAQQALKQARMELEKRIFEHDTCVEEKKTDEILKATLSQIHVAEAVVETARQRAKATAEGLDGARLALRERQATEREATGLDELGEVPPGRPVQIKELDDVLMRDVGGVIKADGRWPLVIDPSGQASVFLRYLDTNYVNALSSNNTEPNRLRRSILGGIRYGKPVVLDLMDCDLWPEMTRIFDAVHPGLLDAIMDKSLVKDEKYLCLVRQEDGEEYDPNKFQDARIASFRFIVLTAAALPNKDMLSRMHAIRVVVKG